MTESAVLLYLEGRHDIQAATLSSLRYLVTRDVAEAHAAGLAQGRAEGLDVERLAEAYRIVERTPVALGASEDNELEDAEWMARAIAREYAALAETPVEAGLDAVQRYTLTVEDDGITHDAYMELDPEGRWVLFRDVAPTPPTEEPDLCPYCGRPEDGVHGDHRVRRPPNPPIGERP